VTKSKSLVISIVILIISYIVYTFLYARAIHRSSEERSKIAEERFFKSDINGTINRVELIYKDNCNTQFWIKHYSMSYIVVNVCKFATLKGIESGTIIKKDSNSTRCTFLLPNDIAITTNIKVEY
jgi:hypothetical protein